MSCPGEASVATTSPMLRGSLSGFLKNSLREFLKRTSTMSNCDSTEEVIFDNQSNTVNLLQESVPQLPLLLHPFGADPSFVEQLEQAISYLSLYMKSQKMG